MAEIVFQRNRSLKFSSAGKLLADVDFNYGAISIYIPASVLRSIVEYGSKVLRITQKFDLLAMFGLIVVTHERRIKWIRLGFI